MTGRGNPSRIRHVTKSVTNLMNAARLRALKRVQGLPVKRPRILRCLQCRNRYAVKPRGREPFYCSRNCRQRAYEARKAAEDVPMNLLKADLVRSDIQALVQREVQAYLRRFLGKLDAEQQLREILRKKGLDDDSLE